MGREDGRRGHLVGSGRRKGWVGVERLEERSLLSAWHGGAGSGGVLAGPQASSGQTMVTPVAGPPIYADPIVITQGGTYTGNWQSLDPHTAAVMVNTTAAVVIQNANIRSMGAGIVTGVSHTKLTVRNTNAWGLNPNVAGRAPGRFLDDEFFDTLVVQNNFLEGTAGISLNTYSGGTSSSNTLKILSNKAHNIDGRHSDGNGGWVTYNTSKGVDGFDIVQFVQLDHVQNLGGIEIAWNQVINDPGLSRVEDVISIYESSGTAVSHLQIHDNYIQGAYTIAPWMSSAGTEDWSYSGGGIMAGDGKAGLSGYVDVHDNQVVATTNYGVAIASGHDINVYNNRVVACGVLADGRVITAQNVGMYISNSYKTKNFTNNRGSGNLVGWVVSGGRNDWWVPNASSWVSNTAWPGTITLGTEADEMGVWLGKLAASKQSVGPLS